ncbi:hypothetical protein [Falsibacillus pallidus]|uniref:Uncharacterized protein n=1 Tax=Falsibacillus pallidus TaxID=493781 RepID=A0A370GW51_9BACI|nr:hypothetical protein [Falsibacillus pallidus]RDI47898.1 hypothetical protein DFR59_101563 [Falsibacillus pallidus]
MNFCSVCNGFAQYVFHCPECRGIMQDQGRLYDYYDEYSAYMDIDVAKLEDGDPESSKKAVCMHLLACTECRQQIIQNIYY